MRRDFNEAGVARMTGEWSGTGWSGEEFRRDHHLYENDLDLFGEGSMFERLCIARTHVGRQRLAEFLQDPVPLEEVLARQEAVRELQPMITLREEMASVGQFQFRDAKRESFDAWLAQPLQVTPKWIRKLLMVWSGVVVILLLLGLFQVIPREEAVQLGPVLLGLNLTLGLMFQEQAKRVTASALLLSTETGVILEGLALMERQTLQTAKLRAITEKARGATSKLRSLERLFHILEERQKDWFYVPSLIVLCSTQCTLAIEAWRAEHGAALREWLDLWAEFEALQSLAGYAWENPDDVIPELLRQEPLFDARGLAHPLLPVAIAVRNDFQLSPVQRLYVISGSNMAGKSTLLRAVGLNTVLAYAGAPVRATSLRLSHFSLGASLRTADSVQEGRSRFMAEVSRLKGILELARDHPPALFLVDEIFSGTNSRDRRAAAEGVVRALLQRGAAGAISTHDLALTEIADLPGMAGVNVHMASGGEDDPLRFDYVLKAGVTQESNALAIVRMTGVEV